MKCIENLLGANTELELGYIGSHPPPCDHSDLLDNETEIPRVLSKATQLVGGKVSFDTLSHWIPKSQLISGRSALPP